MTGFWGRRQRAQITEQDADLTRRADAALIAADERVRLTTDELTFAEAELGTEATQPLREALAAVKQHLGEAFQLNQLNHDDIPDTVEELRTRNARIVQLCEWAEGLIEERMSVLADRIAHARRAPQILAQVQRDIVTLRDALEPARATLVRLGARYSPAALHRVEGNPAEAEQLIGFAEHSSRIAAERREAGQREPANVALEAATESVRRSRALIDAVDSFEIEALRAESTLNAIIEDSRSDLVAAGSAPQTPEVRAAVANLEAALAALPAAGVNTDPFAQLTALREANSGLDATIAAARERAAHPLPGADQVRNAIDDADRQLAIARDIIGGHRGWIGADARTRYAEGERIREELTRLVGHDAAMGARPIDEERREQALLLARRAAYLAAEALQLAQRDIDAARPQPAQGWGGPGGSGWGEDRRGGGNAIGGILGGLVIGSILGDFFN
ncbi:hypothetical protein [Microbacterium terrisoli]|uniref:hypothetical protein n=1 Tax=Microbacterium terrisoli TaxID=3242192 RepID=UPI0028047999|nr:hypothetical protein [Microbacterium protaetiae]